MTFGDKIKQKIWNLIYKVFPTTQKDLLKMGLIWHKSGRQRYHIGWLAPGKTVEELKKHLHEKWGFGNHFIAWEDQGQILSWRRLDSFTNQYHLRVFSDGELRGHFEYTPEAHPIAHFDEREESFHKEDFLKFLGDFVTQEKHVMYLEVDPDSFNPKSEVTIENINK